MKFLAGLILFSFCVYSAPKGWPEQVQEIKYSSDADQTQQPALFYAPEKTSKALPLLVGLHTWSSNYRQSMSASYAQWCIEKKWVFIHPNFRGPNRRPEATGSELVIKDILSAVAYAKKSASIDENRIYLIGASGGGYASLLMAGRAPEVWAGVSAWVPILDLVKWHEETSKRKLRYAGEIEKSIGGKPLAGSKAFAEARKRSAITYLKRAKEVNLDINAGITDGHNGSVPISHSLIAFNILASEKDKISPELVESFTQKAKVPVGLYGQAEKDAAYGAKKVLFRRQSRTTRLTIFQGGHEIIPEAGLQWLAKQKRICPPKNE